ncbi:MAG: hypothetical protein ACXAAO_15850 [Candidatus Thorarchaeota archaeon]|jgi:DNA-binding transcriptional regulator GbsR (MarR family)
MVFKDSLGYDELRRTYRNNLGWLGLNDSEREVLSFLLVENQWTDNPQSPEDIANATGLARSTISAIMSKLIGLGLTETIMDISTGDVVGRRKNFYKVRRGLSGIIIFGVRRIVVELNNLVSDLNTSLNLLDKKDHGARDILRQSIDEAHSSLAVLIDCLEKIPIQSQANVRKD